MTSWRAAHEQAILSSRGDIDVAIVRPAMVYGRGGWVWETWFAPILAARGSTEEKITIPAGREARPSVVHVDDVVSGIHAVIDQIDGRLGSWPVFDLVSEHVGIECIVEAVKEAVGAKNEVEYTGTQGNVFYEALAVRANVDAGRSTIVLGWQPKISDFLVKMGKYVRAFEAAKDAK
jgi:nucleoside-diphosphate-sugar epimerase